MNQYHTHKFLKLFCKRIKNLMTWCAIIIAHHKLEDQTYALERVDIYPQSLIEHK